MYILMQYIHVFSNISGPSAIDFKNISGPNSQQYKFYRQFSCTTKFLFLRTFPLADGKTCPQVLFIIEDDSCKLKLKKW